MDPLTAGLNFLSGIIDKVFPDKDKADQVKLEMFKLQQQGGMQEVQNAFQIALQQIAVNLADAQSGKWWQQWRPFIGWVCGAAFAYNYVVMPFLVWFVALFVPDAPAMPALDMSELTTLLFGMLGLGAMRTIEKVKK